MPFDPTNSVFCGTDPIHLAYTRTPEQAAPVSGSWTGSASDYLGVAVKVSVRRIDAEAAHAIDGDPAGEP